MHPPTGPREQIARANERRSKGDYEAARRLADEAERHLRRALAVLERAVEPTHPALLACLENYRDVLRAMGAAGAPCRSPNGRERDPGGAD